MRAVLLVTLISVLLPLNTGCEDTRYGGGAVGEAPDGGLPDVGGSEDVGLVPEDIPEPRPMDDHSLSVDTEAIRGEADFEWALSVSSSVGVKIEHVEVDGQGNTIVAGQGQGSIDFGGIWSAEAPEQFLRWVFATGVGPSGGGLWQTTFELLPTGDETETLRLGDLHTHADGSSLLSLSWTGALALPNGTIVEHEEPTAWPTLLVHLSAQGRIVWTHRLQIENNNTICEDIEPHEDGWIVSCYGGSGLGLTTIIDRGGQTRMTHETTPLPGEMNYAYLFQSTQALAGGVFVGGWTKDGADLGGLEYPTTDADVYFVARIDAEDGKTAWAMPDKGVQSRLVVDPTSQTLLGVFMLGEEGALVLEGRDPANGGVMWTCRLLFEALIGGFGTIRRGSDGHLTLSGFLGSGDEPTHFLMTLDEDYRPSELLTASAYLDRFAEHADETLSVAFEVPTNGQVEVFGETFFGVGRPSFVLGRARRF